MYACVYVCKFLHTHMHTCMHAYKHTAPIQAPSLSGPSTSTTSRMVKSDASASGKPTGQISRTDSSDTSSSSFKMAPIDDGGKTKPRVTQHVGGGVVVRDKPWIPKVKMTFLARVFVRLCVCMSLNRSPCACA